MKTWQKILIGVVIVIIAIGYLIPESKKIESNPPKKPAVSNSEYDGSVSQVKDWFKQNLKDPSSLEVTQWSKVTEYGLGRNAIGEVTVSRSTQVYDDSLKKSFEKGDNEDKGENLFLYAKWNGLLKVRGAEKAHAFWIAEKDTKPYKDDGIRYSVIVKYRAKNSFGAYDGIAAKKFDMDSTGFIVKAEDY